MLELYRNIRLRRLDLGMSQDELAQRTGYTSRTSIAKIEAGVVDLPQSKIQMFADALNTTPAQLMGWETQPSPRADSPSPARTNRQEEEMPEIYLHLLQGAKQMDLDEHDVNILLGVARTLKEQAEKEKEQKETGKK